MEDLSLHILDIAENSIEAEAKKIEIKIEENRKKDLLSLEIADDGKGMNKEALKKALDPFVTTKTTRRVGLGLPMLAEAAAAAGGRLTLRSQPGKGTKVKATFRLSHIDIKPLGDMAQTLITMLMGHPEVDLVYSHTVNQQTYSFDTCEIKEQLNGVPINSPEVIKSIRKNIKEGLDRIRRQK